MILLEEMRAPHERTLIFPKAVQKAELFREKALGRSALGCQTELGS